jgi:hypothetical protein
MHELTPFYNCHTAWICHHVEQLIVLSYSVGCHGNLVFSNLLPSKDSFVTIRCSGNVILSHCSAMNVCSSSIIRTCSHHVTVFTMANKRVTWVSIKWQPYLVRMVSTWLFKEKQPFRPSFCLFVCFSLSKWIPGWLFEMVYDPFHIPCD